MWVSEWVKKCTDSSVCQKERQICFFACRCRQNKETLGTIWHYWGGPTATSIVIIISITTTASTTTIISNITAVICNSSSRHLLIFDRLFDDQWAHLLFILSVLQLRSVFTSWSVPYWRCPLSMIFSPFHWSSSLLEAFSTWQQQTS